MTEQAQEQATPETEAQPQTQAAPKQEQSKETPRAFTQDDLNKIAANEKREGRTSRESELLEATGAESIDDILEAYTEYQTIQDAVEDEAAKAQKRVSKLETQVETLKSEKATRERYEAVLTGYAATLREGLPESLTGMLDRLDAVDQLEWLTEHRSEYIRQEEPQQVRRAVDTTPRITTNNNATGRERLVNVFGQKYGT